MSVSFRALTLVRGQGFLADDLERRIPSEPCPEVYLAVEAEDLARMIEASHPRERPRSAGRRSKIRW